jgi:hypothetical protein
MTTNTASYWARKPLADQPLGATKPADWKALVEFAHEAGAATFLDAVRRYDEINAEIARIERPEDRPRILKPWGPLSPRISALLAERRALEDKIRSLIAAIAYDPCSALGCSARVGVEAVEPRSNGG